MLWKDSVRWKPWGRKWNLGKIQLNIWRLVDKSRLAWFICIQVWQFLCSGRKDNLWHTYGSHCNAAVTWMHTPTQTCALSTENQYTQKRVQKWGTRMPTNPRRPSFYLPICTGPEKLHGTSPLPPPSSAIAPSDTELFQMHDTFMQWRIYNFQMCPLPSPGPFSSFSHSFLHKFANW